MHVLNDVTYFNQKHCGTKNANNEIKKEGMIHPFFFYF